MPLLFLTSISLLSINGLFSYTLPHWWTIIDSFTEHLKPPPRPVEDGSQHPVSPPPQQHALSSFAVSFSGRKQKKKKALNVEFSTKTKNTGTKTLLEIISSKRHLIKSDIDSRLSKILWNPATRKQVSRRQCCYHLHSISEPWDGAANPVTARVRPRW